MKNISNHTGGIYDLHCLCNILVVKIPKIKVCNPSPFTKNVFCVVIDETMSRVIWNHVLRVFFLLLLFRVFTHAASFYLLFIYLLEQKKAFT